MSVLISVASQVLLDRAYLLPTAAASPAIAALTVFSRAVPAAGLVTDITGPARSMPVICADRANEVLPTRSADRKQAYCPLYDSLLSVMVAPDMYGLPAALLPMSDSSQEALAIT